MEEAAAFKNEIVGTVSEEEMQSMSKKQLQTYRSKVMKAERMISSSEFLMTMAKKMPLHPEFIMEYLGKFRDKHGRTLMR